MADPCVLELMGTDREALGGFDAELFAWHVENVPEPPYAVMDTYVRDAINGGVGSVERDAWCVA